jgi:hypothetical protein
MNATALHRQVGSDVAVTSITRRPRAIVVILGDEVLDDYTELYHKLQCSTISIKSASNSHEMSEWATSVSRETARLVRMAQLSEMGMGNVPVLLHVLGDTGRCLVEALEQQVHSLDRLPMPCGKKLSSFHMNASTRSLFTHETDPMSSDDEDDGDESSHEEDSTRGTIDTFPLSSTPPSPSRLVRRLSSSPSIHRIDMDRTGVSLHHAPNPEERAHQRDFELFCSHVSMMLWDMPPPSRKSGRTVVDLLARVVVWLLVFIYKCIQQWVFPMTTSLSKQHEVPGLSLSHQHALAYVNDKDETVQCLLQEANVVLQTRLYGTRKQHGQEYIEFVQQALDRISSLPNNDEDEGWSSDEEE